MNNNEAVQSFITDLALRGYSKHTIKAYRITIERALQFCSKNFKKVTTQDLKGFLLFLQREKECSLRTIHRHINALRTFYRLYEMDTADKIQLPKVEKTLPTFLNFGEMEKLLDSIFSKRDLAIVRLLYASGLRVSELVGLNRDTIEENVIRVRSGKGKKDRVVFIDDGTLELIGEYLNERADENPALFVNRRGTRLTDRYIEILVKRHAKRAGIKKKVTPHTLRHTFATHLLQNKANIMVIKDLLGHASLSTTQIYTHVTDEYKKEIYENSHPLSKS
ncbi:MAG: tyrosine-type recombinase/integrase [Theionarchaea archaeon]|nr:tyrosine-type recombinase/integrase [Theionarchaea archaeon]